MARKKRNNPDRIPPPQEEQTTQPTERDTRYKGKIEVARGGVGRILRAEDTRLRRPVALKEPIKRSSDGEALFLKEAMLTAQLEHPAIIPVHDVGHWPDGRPFFAMKLIAGCSLKESLDSTRTLAERLALLPHLIDACEAMAYSHSRELIHLDLKPNNILIGEFGETVVIDWGLARSMEEPSVDVLEDAPILSPNQLQEQIAEMANSKTLMGTPSFMSPEQFRSSNLDARTDVYALGAILYYFLTGKPPYQGSTDEIVQKISNAAPVPIEKLTPNAPRELIAIATKAMSRDPKDRYPTARELSADLKQFQVGALVGVYRYTISELLLRWLKKNRLTVAVAATLLSFILVGGSYLLYQGNERLNQAERYANIAAVLQASTLLDKDPASAMAWLKTMTLNREGWSAARLFAQETARRGAARYVFRGHSAIVKTITFSPDGELVASASKDGTVRLWEVASQKEHALLTYESNPSSMPPEVNVAAFSPDGSMLASGDSAGNAYLWMVSTVLQGETKGQALEAPPGAVNALSFSPDGKFIALSGDAGLIRVFSLGDNKVTDLTAHNAPVKRLAFSPDGGSLASLSNDGIVLLWNLSTMRSVPLEERTTSDATLQFSPDGALLASINHDSLLFWSMASPQNPPQKIAPPVTGFAPRVLAFSPDSQSVAAVGASNQAWLWSRRLNTWRAFTGGKDGFLDVRVSPDGKTLAAASEDRFIWLWNIESGQAHPLKGHVGKVINLAFSPDGKSLASTCDYNAVRLWDVSSGGGATTSLFVGHEAALSALAFSQDELFSADQQGSVWRWTLSESKGERLLRLEQEIRAMVLSPDEKRLALASGDRLLFLDIDTNTTRTTSTNLKLRALAFSPDGRLASVSDDGSIRIWSAEGTSETVGQYAGALNAVAFSPDGELLAVGGEDRVVHVLSLKTKQTVHIYGNLDAINALAFSPDGVLLASASKDKSIRLWEVSSALQGSSQLKVILDGHTKAVNSIAFSPDGTQLASTGDDLTTRIWDIESRQSVIVENIQTQGKAVAFSKMGEKLASSAPDHSLVLWENAPIPFTPEGAKTWIETMTTARLDPAYKPRSNW